MLSAPVQERQGVEQRVRPGLADAGSNTESQVDLTLPGLPVENPPLHKGSRIGKQPDKYQAGQ